MNIKKEYNGKGASGMWVWLVPAAYFVHVLEEAFGGHGLMEWMAAGGGVDLSLAEFLGVNFVGLGALCLAAWASRRWEAWRWPLVSGATIFVANGIWHAAICVMTRSYIPGVLTGFLLYIPLGCIVMYRLRHLMSPRSLIVAIVIGMVIHAATIWLVLRMPGFQMG
jgi:hypothetical protein